MDACQRENPRASDLADSQMIGLERRLPPRAHADARRARLDFGAASD